MNENKSKVGLEMKYFILKPKGDSPYAKASRKAMLTYADEIGFRENPQLAAELREWVLKETPITNKHQGCGCGYCNT